MNVIFSFGSGLKSWSTQKINESLRLERAHVEYLIKVEVAGGPRIYKAAAAKTRITVTIKIDLFIPSFLSKHDLRCAGNEKNCFGPTAKKLFILVSLVMDIKLISRTLIRSSSPATAVGFAMHPVTCELPCLRTDSVGFGARARCVGRWHSVGNAVVFPANCREGRSVRAGS